MKFPEWLPDRDAFENPGLVECQNVLPDTFYRPIGSLAASGTAMTATATGAFATEDDSGEVFQFAGDATKLYKRVAGDWSSVNTGYTTTTENSWKFIRFGDLVIGTNRDDVIQKYDITADSVFSALAGSPPQAKHIGIVKNFIVLGNLSTGGNKIQWSGLDDATEWTSGVKESDSQVLPEGGQVMAVTTGEFGLVFQRDNIWRMEYQGPPVNFRLDLIEQGKGTIASGSVVQYGILTYFLDQNGFYVTNGSESTAIGNEKIDKYFFAKWDETLSYKMTSVVDPVNKMIFWSYVGSDSMDGNPNWLLIYNYQLSTWSEVELSHELLFTALSSGYTLEGLDAIYPNIDTMPISLDSRLLQGGALLLAAIDTDHKQATFTGAVLGGQIKTGEIELNILQKSLVTQVWPEIDGTVSVAVSSKYNFADSPVVSAAVATNASGFAPFTQMGAYHQFTFTCTDWTRATGFKMKAEVCGEY